MFQLIKNICISLIVFTFLLAGCGSSDEEFPLVCEDSTDAECDTQKFVISSDSGGLGLGGIAGIIGGIALIASGGGDSGGGSSSSVASGTCISEEARGIWRETSGIISSDCCIYLEMGSNFAFWYAYTPSVGCVNARTSTVSCNRITESDGYFDLRIENGKLLVIGQRILVFSRSQLPSSC